MDRGAWQAAVLGVFSVVMYRCELDIRLSTKELMLLNCGAGEDLESSLDCKEIKPVNPKGNQPWILIGRTDAEAEAPIIWPPDVKNWLIRKDLDARKDWGQEEKGTTEEEIVGWYHRLNGHEFEQVSRDGEGQGSLVCCSPWGHKESDTSERLNNNFSYDLSSLISPGKVTDAQLVQLFPL